MESLVPIAKILGLSGVAVSVFFLLIKSVIEKNVYPQLTKDRAYKLLRLIVLIVFSFSIVVLAFVAVYQILGNKDLLGEADIGQNHFVFLATRESLSKTVVERVQASADVPTKLKGELIMNAAESYNELKQIVADLNKFLSANKACIGEPELAEVSVE